MGIWIVTILLFFIIFSFGLWFMKDDLGIFAGSFLSGILSLFISFLIFATISPIDSKITKEEYLEAVGAKTIIDKIQKPNDTNSEFYYDCVSTVMDYNLKRKHILNCYNNGWNGCMYDQESVKMYPEIKF